MKNDNRHNNNIHETAIIEECEMGSGTSVWHFAHIRKGSKIGKNCNIGKSVYIDKDTIIGDNVKIQNFVSVYKGVIIEDDVFIGPSVTFTNDLYPRSFIWSDDKVMQTNIRRCASIGANSTIVCGVEIGEYAVIGAGSVVSSDILPYELVYGTPATHQGWVCHCGKPISLGRNIVKNIARNQYFCKNCFMPVHIDEENSC